MNAHTRTVETRELPKHRRNYWTTPQGNDVLLVQTTVAVQGDLLDDHAIIGKVMAYESDFDLYLVHTPLGMGWCRDTGLGEDLPILVHVS